MKGLCVVNIQELVEPQQQGYCNTCATEKMVTHSAYIIVRRSMVKVFLCSTCAEVLQSISSQISKREIPGIRINYQAIAKNGK